jgi:Zn-dependent protease with chaperone function
MPLLLLVTLIIACLPLDWPESPVGGVRGSALLTGSVVVGLLLTARAFSLLTVYRVAAMPDERVAIARAHSFRRFVFSLLNLGGFWFILLRCGWGWAARDMLPFRQVLTMDGEPYGRSVPWPGAELLVLLPYLMVMIGAWAAFYDAERALHRANPLNATRRAYWSRWGYVAFLLRHQMLMVFLPVGLVIVQLSLLRTYPPLLTNPWAKLAGLFGLVMFVVLIPSALPLLLGLKPMEPGPLRDRLEAAAKRLGVRYRRLYVWDTRGNLATAMVTGLVPRLRQIVFTDLLLASLTEDEVEAVFGHEVGHVRHGHLLYYAGFLLLSFLTLGATFHVVEQSSGLSSLQGDYVLVSSVLATFGYLFLVFGFVSRRCERQADVFGCKAVSCQDPACGGHGVETALVPRGRSLCRTGVGTFVRALERVDAINGSARGTDTDTRRGPVGRAAVLLRFVGIWLSTWQHGTIAKRIEFLRALDTVGERRFQRRVTWMRWGLLLLLVAGVAGVAMSSGGWQAMLEGL